MFDILNNNAIDLNWLGSSPYSGMCMVHTLSRPKIEEICGVNVLITLS